MIYTNWASGEIVMEFHHSRAIAFPGT